MPASTAYFLNFAAQAFLFIASTRPFTIFPVKTSGPMIPAARAARRLGKFGMHRHRDGRIAAAFLSRNLHGHLAHDLPQVRGPETIGVAQSQEGIVQNVEHQPRLGV
jgi:hypothetical protein